MSARPRFTVITPTLDRSALLRRAVRSVLAQAFESFEHIVVDGGSADATAELLADFAHLHAIVEPDDGIYDALNKGVARARGQWVVFLNSDDELAPGAFAALARAGEANRAAGQLCGAAGFLAENGARLGRRRASMDLSEIAFGAPVFNARAFSAELLRDAGPFDSSLTIAGDREFLLRLRMARTPFARLDHEVYRYRVHAGSLTLSEPPPERSALIAREHAAIAQRALPLARSVGERAVLRAWLDRERSRSHPEAPEPSLALRALATAIRARVALSSRLRARV